MKFKKMIGILALSIMIIVPIDTYAISNLSQVVTGSGYTIALKSDGTVWSWGENGDGELGLGDDSNRSTPTQINNLSNISQITSGMSHSFAVKKDGTVWSWGYNGCGQLGLGDKVNRSIPTQIPGLSNVSQIVAGFGHTVALKKDGTVWSWGQNTYGELGLGDNTDRNIPTQIPGLSNVSQIVSGYNHVIAVKEDGTVWSWGYNSSGELGLGDNGRDTHRNIPTQIPGLSDISKISTGGYTSFVIKKDGTVWSWGQNTYGELGLGDEIDRNIPTQIAGFTNVFQIAGGWCHSLAIKDDGTVWAWGDNCSGELGLGDEIDRNAPTQIIGFTNVSQIAGGWCHSLAIKDDGTTWSWGYNDCGQLGLGDDGRGTERNIPTRIASNIEVAVEKAEQSKDLIDIETARNLVNQLPESLEKDQLQDRLDAITLNETLERKTASANLDVYIKCENILMMSLDTNSITFEDFSGVEDMEKVNAVNISINSSLPYQLNAYLPTEIQNSDKSITMNKDILNIKENSETVYQTFVNTTDKIILKDNCPSGNNLIHGIDIKLKGGIAHEKDIYKTTVKFEAEQK